MYSGSVPITECKPLESGCIKPLPLISHGNYTEEATVEPDEIELSKYTYMKFDDLNLISCEYFFKLLEEYSLLKNNLKKYFAGFIFEVGFYKNQAYLNGKTIKITYLKEEYLLELNATNEYGEPTPIKCKQCVFRSICDINSKENIENT
jgi:hypothetical protein